MTFQDFLVELWRFTALWSMGIVFLAPLEKKKSRLLSYGASCILPCFAAFFLLRILPAGFYKIWISPAIALFFVSLFFWRCAELSLKSSVYFGVWVTMVGNLVVMISTLLYPRFPFLVAFGISTFMLLILLFVIYATIARWMPDKGKYHTGPRQFTFALVLWVISVITDLWFASASPTPDHFTQCLLMLLIKFYCITVLYLQHGLFQKSAIRQELALLNTLWAQQKNQYALSKENIALINQKCHDLKHQIKAMQTMFSGESREKYLQEIERSVRIYDVRAKTGNEVLDTVLTEKSLLCEANGIQANCVADGRLLSFMDPVDLYTIFGNALDNAIESVSTIEDRNRRIIDVQVYREKQMMVIQIINPVTQNIRFDSDDLPVTTKENNGYHGFGLRSIRHTIKKYGGFMTVKVEDGSFYLRLLLPCQSKTSPITAQ